MLAFKNKLLGSVFSFSLAGITIESSSAYCSLNLSVGTSAQTIYSEKLWFHNGSVTVYNLNELIEDYMRDNKIISMLVSLTTTNDAGEHDNIAVNVFYCDSSEISEVMALDHFNSNFLTTLQSRRISPEYDFSLYLYSQNSEREFYELNISYSVQGEETLKSVLSHGYVQDFADQIYAVDLNMAELRRYAATDARVSASLIDIKSFSVSCGDRYAVFYVDKTLLLGETFIFRNIFNAIDWVTVPALTNSKIEVDRSMAVLPGKSAFYDRVVTKNYELQSGPLSFEEAELTEQLAASHEAYKYEPIGYVNAIKQYAVKEILITDSDISYSDSDEPQSVKFTWRYAVNRPPILLTDPARIFTSEYNKVFS